MKKLSWDWETCVNHPIGRVRAYGARKVVRKQESWVCFANAQRAGDNPPWHGAKTLVVEDNHLQAEVVSDFLHDCGLEPVGPAGRLEEACELAQGRPLDGALLDVKLGENLCFPACMILAARKIPFILLTGYCQSSLIPPELCAAPLVCKPFREDELGAALALILNCRVGNRASANVAAGGSLINR
jgi:DNA-binding response OmpR family regulator